jgi:uncharacterized protein (TIGR02145 family)
MKYCSKHHANPDDAVFCNECGERLTRVTNTSHICPKCGASNPTDAKYCNECGYQLSNIILGHDFVDLGLSVKWATCNIGAKDPTEYGDYFAWGETVTKSNFCKNNCETYIEENAILKLFCNNSLKHKVTTDIKGNSAFDVATSHWGKPWRMPSKEEFEELISRCKWEWIFIGKIYGYKITAVNNNHIFLPAAGAFVDNSLFFSNSQCNYWSSTPKRNSLSNSFYLSSSSYKYEIHSWSRYIGRSIRAVYDDKLF